MLRPFLRTFSAAVTKKRASLPAKGISSLLSGSEKRFLAADGKVSAMASYHLTRATKVNAEREKYLSMSVEEKRKFYSSYVQVEEIETWPVHAAMKKLKPESDISSKMFASRYDVDESLNEKVSLWRGDITKLEIDAIVNAANQSLMGGGGVDGCIHRAAGPLLVKECGTLGGCRTGDAKTTCGYKLPAKYVVHTVGPMGEHTDMLRSCYTRCFEEARDNNIRTIAFPCIATGIYGYPNNRAALVAMETTRKWLEKNSDKIDRVIFCLFLDIDVEVYETRMFQFFPVTSDS